MQLVHKILLQTHYTGISLTYFASTVFQSAHNGIVFRIHFDLGRIEAFGLKFLLQMVTICFIFC